MVHLRLATVLLMVSRTDSCFRASETEETWTIRIRQMFCRCLCFFTDANTFFSCLQLFVLLWFTWVQLVLVALHSKLQSLNAFSCFCGGHEQVSPRETAAGVSPGQVCYLWTAAGWSSVTLSGWKQLYPKTTVCSGSVCLNTHTKHEENVRRTHGKHVKNMKRTFFRLRGEHEKNVENIRGTS